MTTRAPASAGRPQALASAVRRAVRDKAVWLAAVAAFLIEMAFSARYGYVRDELYFLAAGAHPAAGYVDQPSLTPLLAHLDALVTGNTLALVGGRCPRSGSPRSCCSAAAMARALGAGRPRPAARRDRGRAAAPSTWAPCTSSPPPPWTSSPWAVVLYLVTRLLTSRGDPRWWPAIGGRRGHRDGARSGTSGSSLLGCCFWVRGHARGAAAAPRQVPGSAARSAFVVLAAPDFLWQAAARLAEPGGVPHALHGGSPGQNRVQYWPGQVLYTSILACPAAAARHPLGVAPPAAARHRLSRRSS